MGATKMLYEELQQPNSRADCLLCTACMNRGLKICLCWIRTRIASGSQVRQLGTVKLNESLPDVWAMTDEYDDSP